MGETWLVSSSYENDFILGHKLNKSKQCDAAVKKLNVVLRCINRSTDSGSQQVTVPLYSCNTEGVLRIDPAIPFRPLVLRGQQQLEN